MTSTPQVRLESSAGVARIVLDRPPLNVLNIAMLGELAAAVSRVAADSGVRVAVVTGAGRAFSAGVDVADHRGDRAVDMLAAFHGVIRGLRGLPQPVVAALNGVALGGGLELALACDLVVAAETAKLGQPEIQLGFFPPAAAALLPRQIGLQRALDLILTGRTLSAQEARDWGLVSYLAPEGGLAPTLAAVVDRLASFSGPVLRLAKRATHAGLGLEPEQALSAAERVYMADLMALADPREGVAAFLDKRTPVWKHR